MTPKPKSAGEMAEEAIADLTEQGAIPKIIETAILAFHKQEVGELVQALEFITYAPNATIPHTDKAIKEMMLEIATDALRKHKESQ